MFPPHQVLEKKTPIRLNLPTLQPAVILTAPGGAEESHCGVANSSAATSSTCEGGGTGDFGGMFLLIRYM